MTHQLSGLAVGRCIAVLEGGYNFGSISAADVSVCGTLQSRSCKVVLREEIEEFAAERPKLHPDALISLRKAASVSRETLDNDKRLQVPGDQDHECDTYIPSSSSSESQSGEVESLLVALETEENATINKMNNEENRRPGTGGSSSESNYTADDSRSISSGSNDAPGGGTLGTSSDFNTLGPLMKLPVENPVLYSATCPHLVQVNDVPAGGIEIIAAQCTLTVCKSQVDVWICLTCYRRHCANVHAEYHNRVTHHPIVLSMTDLYVWCFSCEAYVYKETLIPVLNAVDQMKRLLQQGGGAPMP